MNKEWSELNKQMQLQLKKKDSFDEGIATLLLLRSKLMEQIFALRKELTVRDFSAVPYKNANGYHSKTIAYSLWHIFRIEDIVSNTLIADREQVFFEQDYQKRISSPIITTGNEITSKQLAEFSEKLDIDELYNYISDVDKATTDIVKSLSFEDMKSRISDERKKRLLSLDVVSKVEEAFWLIDYWCGKDIRGLIQMPLSRHWIMHIEACLRIREKIITLKKKGVFMRNDITIRPETTKDYKDIISLVLRSFKEGTDYSDGSDIIALIEEIRMSEYYIPELSFVAELDGKIVGHFLFSRFPLSETKEGGHINDGSIVMLAPVSVHADYFHQHIGITMLKLGIEEVKKRGFKGINVEGDYHFYNRVGFKTSSEYGIYPTSGFPMKEPKCMMCMETYEGSLENINGYVVYDMYYNA